MHNTSIQHNDSALVQIMAGTLFASIDSQSLVLNPGFYALATRESEFRFLHFSAIFWQIFVRFFGRLLVDFKEKGKRKNEKQFVICQLFWMCFSFFVKFSDFFLRFFVKVFDFGKRIGISNSFARHSDFIRMHPDHLADLSKCFSENLVKKWRFFDEILLKKCQKTAKEGKNRRKIGIPNHV